MHDTSFISQSPFSKAVRPDVVGQPFQFVNLLRAKVLSLTSMLWLLTLLSGCDDKPTSFNECLLKNLKNSADRTATGVIVEACERMFTKDISIELSTGMAGFDSATHPTNFTASLSNPNRDYRITTYAVVVSELQTSANVNPRGAFTWFSTAHIEPNGSTTFTGRWEGPPLQTPWTWYAEAVAGLSLSQIPDAKIEMASPLTFSFDTSALEHTEPKETNVSSNDSWSAAFGFSQIARLLKNIRPWWI